MMDCCPAPSKLNRDRTAGTNGPGHRPRRPIMSIAPTSAVSGSAVRPIVPVVAPITEALSPLAEPMVRVAAGLVQFGGGLFLAAGFAPRAAATLVAGLMFVAIVQVHWAAGFFWTSGGYEDPLLWGLVALSFAI